MRLKVYDVGHGSCIALIHENGNVMLWDCGHKEGNRPSNFLPASGIGTIHRLFVTNFDEDHVSDLPSLRQNLNIQLLHTNTTISQGQLRNLKLLGGPLSPAMESMLDMMGDYTGGSPSISPAFPRVNFNVYYNSYPTDFNDSNNISLVTILDCDGTKFLIPGDIEKQGWEKLLRNQSFCHDLSGVNVFIASHHGRESGYCSDVFNHCSPDVIVFSDSNIKYATQETASQYASHASGITFNGNTHRYVLSTRNDGDLWWDL